MKKFALLVFVVGLVAVGCYPQRQDTTTPNDPKAPKAPGTSEKTKSAMPGGTGPGMPGTGGPGMPGGGMPKPPGK